MCYWGGRWKRCKLYDYLGTNRSGTPPGGKRHLIQGEGSAARMSNELRPQDPSGGVRLTTSRANICALPVDTYAAGVVERNLFLFPCHRGLVSGRCLDRPAAALHDSPIGSLLKRSSYPQC